MKKLLTFAVAISTIVWSVGLLATPLAVGAAMSGDLIKLQCAAGADVNDPCRAVYYLGADSKRYVFPNAKTYMTWYPDFSGVKIVSATEMSSYAIGGNVTYRPGVKLVKITTDPKVYAVSANGTLRWVTSAAVAAELYGANWATLVEDVSDAFFVNYTVGADITTASQFDKAAELASASSINEDKNLGTAIPSGSSLSVSLAADTPASGIVVEKAARVPFTKINVTAAADGDVIIDQWTVERMGLAGDACFASVDILDAATMMPINEVGKTFTSDHTATFSEDVVIKAGTTRSFYIAGNMATVLDTNAGEVPSLALRALKLKGTAAVVGTLPIVGNYQTTNATIVIGGVAVTRGAYSNASTTLEVGKVGYTFASIKVEASDEDILLNTVRVYQLGSVSLKDDLGNMKLYLDGTLLSTATVNGNYLEFVLTAPLSILKGQSKQLVVKGDVISGSGRTIKLGVYNTNDLTAKGTTYGYNITPAYSGTGSSTDSPVLTDNEFTVSQGTLRVGRSNTVAAGNITVGADQVIGAFEFEAKGEATNVSKLELQLVTSTVKNAVLKSIKLVDKDGNVVAGPVDITYSGATAMAKYTTTFTVPIGLNVYKVLATLETSGNLWTTDDTVKAKIDGPSAKITAKGEVTNLNTTISPASAIEANLQTVKTAALSVSRRATPSSKNVIPNSSGILIGSWSFDASNSGEDVRITALAIKASTTGKVNNLTLKKGSAVLYPVNDSPSTGNSVTTSTFALSEPIVVAKGTSEQIDLYGDIATDANAGEVMAFGITSAAAITAYGTVTGNEATLTVTPNDGAQLTVAAAGTLTVTQHNDAAGSKLILAGQKGVALSDVKLEASNEDIDITDLHVNVADGGLTARAGDYSQIEKFYLKLDGTLIGNTAGYTLDSNRKKVTVLKGAITVPRNGTKKLSVVCDMVAYETGDTRGTANADIMVGLGGANGFVAYGKESNTATVAYSDSTGSPVILHKAYPSVTKIETGLSSTLVHKAKVSGVGGSIGLYRIAYEMSSTTNSYVKDMYPTLESCVGGCGGLTAGEVLSAIVAYPDVLSPNAKYGVGFALDIPNQTTKEYLGVGEGAEATIGLRASAGLSGTATQGAVNTSFLGDTATTSNEVSGAAATNYVTYDQGNFVWSDLNLDSSQTATALAALQWYNGYLVEGLGTSATTGAVKVDL